MYLISRLSRISRLVPRSSLCEHASAFHLLANIVTFCFNVWAVGHCQRHRRVAGCTLRTACDYRTIRLALLHTLHSEHYARYTIWTAFTASAFRTYGTWFGRTFAFCRAWRCLGGRKLAGGPQKRRARTRRTTKTPPKHTPATLTCCDCPYRCAVAGHRLLYYEQTPQRPYSLEESIPHGRVQRMPGVTTAAPTCFGPL